MTSRRSTPADTAAELVRHVIADGARTRRAIALIAALTSAATLIITPLVGLMIASSSSGLAIGSTAAASLGLNWLMNRRRRIKR